MRVPSGSGWPGPGTGSQFAHCHFQVIFGGCVSSIMHALQLFGSMDLAPHSWGTVAAQGPPLTLLGMTVREARRGEQVKTDCSPFAASTLGSFDGVGTHLP